MPIYEYSCKSCNAKFEKLVRQMSSTQQSKAEQIPCPECGSMQTARALSDFAVGAESSTPSSAPGCGRCGGPGPCAMG